MEQLVAEELSGAAWVWEVLVKSDEVWNTLLQCNFDEVLMKTKLEGLTGEQTDSFFGFGIGCLLAFVQANFTGPDLPAEVIKHLQNSKFDGVDFVKLLSANNEDINVNVKYHSLFVAARAILQYCKVSPVINLWWSWRVLMIHQLILDELSPDLLATARQLEKVIGGLELEGFIKAKLEIEQAQLFLTFRHFSKAEVHLTKASEILGLKYELVGKLGKRTKYQQNYIAQIGLKIELEPRDNICRPLIKETAVPKNVYLDDETRLEKIDYVDAIESPPLPNAEQELLIAIIHKLIISKPQDELYYEEIKPFIDVLLSQNNTWAVRAAALLIRSKLEANHNRTIERSLMQVEEIFNCIRKSDADQMTRVSGVFGSALQPIWKTENQQADLMLNLGLVKSALDAYLRLQHWEEVIVCYTILDMRHKAAEIIRQELDKRPTAKLWCLLGDATDDITCYETAWLLSKERSHRAQRHWGMYFYRKHQYNECIPHMEKSVNINPLQPQVWLRLGFSALEVENWRIAANAYRQYTTLEPDSFEAWNNLAQAYIKLGNKKAAHQALHDALRCNFDNWKVWENLLVVSADISHFRDVIRAYHQLLSVKEKYLNTRVLGILVYSVCNNLNDHDGNPCESLLQKTRELFGRVTAVHPSDGFVWELYSHLAPSMYLRAQRLQRAYRGYTSQPNWDKSWENCKQLLNVLRTLAEAVLDGEIDPKDPIVQSVRLTISSAVSCIKKHGYDEVKSAVEDVTALLSSVLEKAKLGLTAGSEPANIATSSEQSTTSV